MQPSERNVKQNHTGALPPVSHNDLPNSLLSLVGDGNASAREDEPPLDFGSDVAGEPAAQYYDGQLLHVHPSLLLDMQDGGNTRKKRKNHAELKESIKNRGGIFQSVTARPHPTVVGALELLAGYGRRDCATELDLMVPVHIRDVDDKEALLIHLAENKDRSDIDFGDEVRFVRRYLSLFAGDRDTAISASGWSAKKFNERAELLKAVEPVLNALDDQQITIKHALILSSFDDAIQVNTLAKVISEKWSVETLKIRADKVLLPLSAAIFDQSECLQCPHNTIRQANLFDFGDVVANCAKGSCYTAKTKVALEAKKFEAEERYGRVLWLSEALPEDRVTLDSKHIGIKQIESGCSSCADKVVVLNDKLGAGVGQIIENQCIQKSCYKECVTAFKASQTQTKNLAPAEAGSKTQAAAAKEAKTTPAAGKAPTKPNVDKSVIGSVSQPVIEAHQKELRIHAANHLKGNRVFELALQAFALIKLTDYRTNNIQTDLLAALMQRSEDDLNNLLAKVTAFALETTKTFAQVPAYEFLAVAAVATDTGAQLLKDNWTPSKENLEKYTTSQIGAIAQQSKLDQHQPDSYKKAASGKKDDLVTYITGTAATGFDWTSYAPLPYCTLIEAANKVVKKSKQA